MDFNNKKVLVCGMARSGVAAANLLKRLGADVTVQDKKEKDALPGDLLALLDHSFPLITGENPDNYLNQFDLLILSPGIPTELPFIQKAREMGIPVWGEVELAFLLTPCQVCAITGTNGKTTTTALTGTLLKQKYDAQVVGNIGVPYTEKVSGLNKNDYVVLEASSFQLETICRFHPHIAAVLNITPDHLDRHKTMKSYIKAKENIFVNQNEEDYLVLNYDDPITREMAAKSRGKVVYFSKQPLPEGIFLEDNVITIRFGTVYEKICPKKSLKILGEHNIENALAATAMAYCAGVALEDIKMGLSQFQGVSHRIEFVREKDGVQYFNDSKATNVDAAIRGVKAMERPVVLIGGGYDKNADYTPWIQSFENKVKALILLGATAIKIEECAEKENFTPVIRVDSLKEAVLKANELAAEGDCVLLSPACASWDMFQDFEQRGELFKELVTSL